MKLAIVGIVGIPANYGGFETLAENLVRFNFENGGENEIIVYCSSASIETRSSTYFGARLRYIRLKANGIQSILYDVLALLDAVRRRVDVILLLGVSGAMLLPFIRTISRARIVTNIDGIEWSRAKWSLLARFALKCFEWSAVRFSHAVISDNEVVQRYVFHRYGVKSRLIAYGGDHALNVAPVADANLNVPREYVIAVCRIEPENNVAMILEAFSRVPHRNLVFVGNWDGSKYAKSLKLRYSGVNNLHLLLPIYDVGRLRWLRSSASAYVHGHSAGGTNPSLVEMMHFGLPVLAYDCAFNRSTTEDAAIYFRGVKSLIVELEKIGGTYAGGVGVALREIARKKYSWDRVAGAYFGLIESLG